MNFNKLDETRTLFQEPQYYKFTTLCTIAIY